MIERREQRFLYFTVGYCAGGVNENVQSAEDIHGNAMCIWSATLSRRLPLRASKPRHRYGRPSQPVQCYRLRCAARAVTSAIWLTISLLTTVM